jgi:3-methyladenine DNA glycosylase AlkD
MTLSPWEARLVNAVRAASVPGVAAVLQDRGAAHGGTPDIATMSRSLRLIRGAHAGQPSQLCELALSLVAAEFPACQQLGAILLAEQYPAHPADVAAALRRLAESPHHEVREWAASACGQVLAGHCEPFGTELRAWSRAPLPDVRRTVALAVMYAARHPHLAGADPLLDLLEPLLSDQEPCVRNSLGRVAIGAGLLGCCPEATLSRLERWAGSDEEQVRWNVAMAFATAEGARHPERARTILGRLAADPHSMVRQAVRAALRNLEKRSPGSVRLDL